MPESADITETPETTDHPTGVGLGGTTVVLLVAAFVMILNETAMNVALATIMVDLGITERSAQWLTTAFMLAMATVIPATGWLLQNYSTRTVFTGALSLFCVGTALCASAPFFGALFTGRVVQAMGTALIIPLLMTTIMRLVSSDRRGQVMGTVSLVISVAPAIGPTVAGLILQFLPWRFVFWLVLPLVVLLLVAGLRSLRDVGVVERSQLDLWSLPLAAVAFGGFVAGASQLGSPTVPAWLPATALTVAAVALVLFVRRQVALQRTDSALLDLRTFTHPTFAIAMGVVAVAMMALFGTLIMLPLLLQQALHLTPLTVGLLGLPGGILMGGGSQAADPARRHRGRCRPRPVLRHLDDDAPVGHHRHPCCDVCRVRVPVHPTVHHGTGCSTSNLVQPRLCHPRDDPATGRSGRDHLVRHRVLRDVLVGGGGCHAHRAPPAHGCPLGVPRRGCPVAKRHRGDGIRPGVSADGARHRGGELRCCSVTTTRALLHMRSSSTS